MGIRVLLVEYDVAYAEVVVKALTDDASAEWSLVVVRQLDEAIAFLHSENFTAIVLDLDLPDSRGVDTFDRLFAAATDVPIVILTASDNERVAIAALREGADDYVTKDDAEVRSLPGAVRRAIERQVYLESLRTTAVRYRSLVERSVQGIMIHLNGTIRFANQALADLIGVRHWSDLVDKSIWQAVFPDDRQLVARHAEARAKGRSAPPRYELRIVRRDGAVRWVDCVVSEIVWDGELTAMAALVDITDRKQAEEHLRASEERFRLLADNIKEAFLIIEFPSDRALYLSRAWEEIWGRPVEEAYQNPLLWVDTIHPDDQVTMSAAHQTLERGEPLISSFRVYRPDGSTCWVRARVFPVRGDRGAVYRLVGLIEDITAIRETEEQLRQALKMEAIGQLAGGIAHDFNNLLVVIGGYADLIAEDLGRTHRSRQDLEEIRAATNSAASLTRQLLAFSRQQILQPQVIDLNQVLRRVEQLLRRVIGEHITLAMNLAPTLARVFADPGQVEQIVMNLAINGRDAMPNGGRLSIETSNIDLDEAYVLQHRGASTGPHTMIAVSDTGIGMDAATQQRLFEPFFTTKPVGRGTGLGLSTVYGIVKQSGGSIWVYSEVGKGSTFKIYLPVATTPLEEPRQVPRPSRPITGLETVLVLEDQPEVRRVVVETLQRHGYRVLAAGIVDEAVDMVRETAVDVLLADVVLPGLSGRQIAQRVVAVRPTVRVIYTSGYTDEFIVQHGVLESGLAFLQKPFTAHALLTKIREVLESEVPPPW